MISAPACQEAAPSRLCVMQDMDVSHRSVRSLHPDLSTTLPLRARSLCLTASLTPRRSWIKCRLLDKSCGEPFVQPMVHLSDPRHRRQSGGCASRLFKVALSPVKGRRHIEHKAPHLLADTRSRVASWLTAAGQMQFASQGLLWFPIRLGFRNRKSTVRDISHSNLHVVGFDTKSSIRTALP
jgi:hypothetical protein